MSEILSILVKNGLKMPKTPKIDDFPVLKLNPTGFDWGAASVQRMESDSRKGSVTLSINTPKETLQVYISRTGVIRVFSLEDEWEKPVKNKAEGHLIRRK